VGERRLYRILSISETLQKYKHLIHFDMDTVVKHGFEFHDNGFIPIHFMYKEMILKYLTDNIEITHDDIVYALSNNIQPQEMANILKNNKKPEEPI
jgi:hypothetical protein